MKIHNETIDSLNLCQSFAHNASSELAEDSWKTSFIGFSQENFLNPLFKEVNGFLTTVEENLEVSLDSYDTTAVVTSLYFGYLSGSYLYSKEKNFCIRFIAQPILNFVRISIPCFVSLFVNKPLLKDRFEQIKNYIFFDRKINYINTIKNKTNDLFYSFCIENIPKDACPIGEEEETMSRLRLSFIKKIAPLPNSALFTRQL